MVTKIRHDDPPPAEAVLGHNQPPEPIDGEQARPVVLTSEQILAAVTAIENDEARVALAASIVKGIASILIADPYQDEREMLLATVAVWQDGQTDEAGNVISKPVTEIKSEAAVKPATDLGARLAKLGKADDKRRELVKAPFLAGGALIEKTFKDREKTAVGKSNWLGELLKVWREYIRKQAEQAEAQRLADLRAAEEAEREARAKLAAAGEAATLADLNAARAATDAADAAAVQVAQVQQQAEQSRITRGHVGSASGIKSYKVVIEDETKIPREYFDFNEGRAKAALIAGKKIPGWTGIPGLRLVEDEKTSFR